MLAKPPSENDRASLAVDRSAQGRAVGSAGDGADPAGQILHYGGGALGGIVGAYFGGAPGAMTGYNIGSMGGDLVYRAGSDQLNPDDFVNAALAAKRASGSQGRPSGAPAGVASDTAVDAITAADPGAIGGLLEGGF